MLVPRRVYHISYPSIYTTSNVLFLLCFSQTWAASEMSLYSSRWTISNEKHDWKKSSIPSRELTYPTWGKGKSSSKVPFWGDMLVPRRVRLQLVLFFSRILKKYDHQVGISLPNFSGWKFPKNIWKPPPPRRC